MDLRPAGLVTAVSQEFSTVSKALRPHAASGRVLVVQSGMGRAAAFLAANELAARGAGRLVSIGVCGALSGNLRTGAVLLPPVVVTPEARDHVCDREWHARALAALGDMALAAPLLTAGDVVSTPEAKRAAGEETGAVGVDMESAGIAEAAARHGLPFLALRVVLDEAGDSLPGAAARAVRPDGNLDMGGLLRALAARPGDIAPLMRLGRKTAAACKALRTVLARLEGELLPPA